jgi:hypothetical protein
MEFLARVMEDFILMEFCKSWRYSKEKFHIQINSDQKQITVVHENGAIFFNQPLYLFYLSEDKFINGFLATSYNFSPFLFKFHPSDTESLKF